MRRMLLAFTAMAACSGLATGWAQTFPHIGLTSATKNEVIVVGDSNRGLKTGDTIFQNQHIRTGRDSAAQLLFRDETSLTMGPNSALVLDKAVYDPEKHVGEITVRATSGAFRFISGSSPSTNYTINTPAGTVGIRGTWIEFLLENGGIRLIVRHGLAVFCPTPSQCTRVLPGYELRAFRDRVGTPQKVSHETVESIVALWFKEGSEADLANLAPGAGPGDGTGGPNNSGKPFWWLDGNFRGSDFRPHQFTQTSGPGQTTDNPPPFPGPSPNVLQRKAWLFVLRVAFRLYVYIDRKVDNRWEARKVARAIRHDVRDLKEYVRTTIPTIQTPQDLRDFKREVRSRAREIRQDVRHALRHHHHHHRHRRHNGNTN